MGPRYKIQNLPPTLIVPVDLIHEEVRDAITQELSKPRLKQFEGKSGRSEMQNEDEERVVYM